MRSIGGIAQGPNSFLGRAWSRTVQRPAGRMLGLGNDHNHDELDGGPSQHPHSMARLCTFVPGDRSFGPDTGRSRDCVALRAAFACHTCACLSHDKTRAQDTSANFACAASDLRRRDFAFGIC